MGVLTAEELTALCKLATKKKTLYVMGCFGAPMTEGNKKRYCFNHPYNAKPERTAKIRAASADTFGFDCVCLIKGLLWGWRGDAGHVYGGAAYGSNGVPDLGADGLFGKCTDTGGDFSAIVPGEAVWMPGHIGIYVGEGLAAECTPAWADGVQLTACNCKKEGCPTRNWQRRGRLPYVSYGGGREGLPTLRRGSTGAAVKAMQLLLIGYGFSCGSWGADGEFGEATLTALRSFQRSRGLEPDGICGQLSWNALLGVT